MGLPTIVMTVCQLINGQVSNQCKDVSIPLDRPAQLSAEECAGRAGQIEMSRWIGDNPGWWITRWKCPQIEKEEQGV